MTDDHVRLVLPADPAYGRIARICASNLALRLGFTRADIEDLRIALDELVILLLRPDGAEGTMTIEFTVTPTGLVISASTSGTTGRPADAEALARFNQIVGPTVDRIQLEGAGTQVSIEKLLPA